MKLIAGSILASFGLLVTALGGLEISVLETPIGEHYYWNLDDPIEILAILFVVVAVGLIGWGIWETVTKKEI